MTGGWFIEFIVLPTLIYINLSDKSKIPFIAGKSKLCLRKERLTEITTILGIVMQLLFVSGFMNVPALQVSDKLGWHASRDSSEKGQPFWRSATMCPINIYVAAVYSYDGLRQVNAFHDESKSTGDGNHWLCPRARTTRGRRPETRW